MKQFARRSIIVAIFLMTASQGFAWHDKTHLAIAKAGGLVAWYNAAGADMAKIKAGNIEGYNHYFNNNAEIEITPALVLAQAERYNERNKWLDTEGHLLGAIIGSLRAYDKYRREGKYPKYHLPYCAHYIGDLSQPLHNIPFDSYNQSLHEATDGVVDRTILDEPQKIIQHMYAITLSADQFEKDLAREIARIANLTRQLGYTLRRENRLITKEEAYVQLGHSASLLKAVLEHYPQ
jgi:hypothetical protein